MPITTQHTYREKTYWITVDSGFINNEVQPTQLVPALYSVYISDNPVTNMLWGNPTIDENGTRQLFGDVLAAQMYAQDIKNSMIDTELDGDETSFI